MVSASNMVILRSLPPRASSRPSGETSKLVTGLFATVLVLISFQVLTSQTDIKAFRSPFPRCLADADPALLGGVALTTVRSREAVWARPKRAARKVHLRVLLRTGCWITWLGSGTGSEAVRLSETGQTLILCSEAPRNWRTVQLDQFV